MPSGKIDIGSRKFDIPLSKFDIPSRRSDIPFGKSDIPSCKWLSQTDNFIGDVIMSPDAVIFVLNQFRLF